MTGPYGRAKLCRKGYPPTVAIPPEITAAHIRQALRHIDENGVPPRRQATRFHLVYRSRQYPPKYVICVAAELGTGRALWPDDFGGGDEANQFLVARGFTVAGDYTEVVVKREPRQETKLPRPSQRSVDAVEQPEAAVVKGDVTIARIALRNSWEGSPDGAREVLQHVFSQACWPRGTSAEITITPGGLIHQRNADAWHGSYGWKTEPRDFEAAVCRAVPLVDRVLTPGLLRAARARTRWLTIGVDLVWGEDESRIQPHAEMVAIVDVERAKVVGWTGKSFPVLSQERLLIQAPLDSHFVTLNRRRVLVLGCHDLNMYNPRGYANQTPSSPRRRQCDAFRRLCRKNAPTIVVQHPHHTDSPNIWRNAWAALTEDLPTVKDWASGIYYAEDDDPRRELADVLRSTRSPGGVLDLVIAGR